MSEYREREDRRKTDKECDIRVWSDSCQRSEFSDQSEKYLCEACGKVPVLHHEMQHKPFPYLSGNEDDLS